MKNIKKVAKKSLAALEKSNKTLRDIYSIIFSHNQDFAYERLVDYEIDAVTYKAHDAEIRAFGAYLKNTYPGANGAYIGIDLSNAPNFLIAFWGALMSGYKPYLVNSFYPSALRIKILKKLGVKLVITNAAGYADFTLINVDACDEKCPPITDEFWQNEFALSSTMTGLEAKICVYDGAAVSSEILNTQSLLKDNNWLIAQYQKRAKGIMILPLFHIFGIMVSYFWVAFLGGTLVFCGDNSPETIRGTINRHKVTHIFAPPIFFHKLYKGIMIGISQESEKRKKKFQNGQKFAYALQNIFPLPGVAISKKLFREVLAGAFGQSPQCMISGGAHINSDALKTINCIGYPLFNGYGTTETAITGVNLAKRISPRIDGSIGHPFESVSYTCDDDGTLLVSGSSICKRIITFQGEESDFCSIKTNDSIKTINGQHFIMGRKSELYVGENGENISPDMIQNELKAKNANRFCVLEIDGRLAVVLEYGEKLPCSIIANEIERIKNALANITYGQHINDIFITHQPIANSNAIKVSRALLRQRISGGEVVLTDYRNQNYGGKKQSGEANEATDDAMMLSIKQVFKCAINTEAEVQSSSDFFIDLEGDSLSYITMICELESIFNIQINLENNKNLRTPVSFYKHIGEVLS